MDFSGIPGQGMMPPEGMGIAPEDVAAGMLPPGDVAAAAYQEQMYPPGQLAGMEAREYTEFHRTMIDGGDRFGSSAVLFDDQEEFVWTGNQGGHVTSYYGLNMQKYTSFQVHHANEVRQLLGIDSRILSLTSDQLRCSTKFGRTAFNYVGEGVEDLQCMLITGPSKILLGGHQPKVIELDFNTQQEIQQVEIGDPGCAVLKLSQKFICTGDTRGKVVLRDPNTFKAEHVLDAHAGTLSDFDVHGNQLVTCGFAQRMGNLTADRFLMVYDLRVMRAVAPMQVSFDPMYLRFVPGYSNRICVVSQTGQFQLLEQGTLSASSMMIYHVANAGAPVSGFDISSSCQAMAFGDSGGYLHMFANSEQSVFNQYSTETVFPQVEQHQPIYFNDYQTPYSVVPMQYPTEGKLLSYWPDQFCHNVYRIPEPIDPEILRTVKMVGSIGYAPNPGNRLRNQCVYQKTGVSHHQSNQSSSGPVPASPIGRGEDPFAMVPKRYRKVEIKYSKLGVEDFDFWHYNKTNFAGLEPHIPNAYCNAMLQMIFCIEPLRCALLSHVCEKEFCLTCELGFLCHMFDQQKGKTCQASNFLRAFRTIPEASALGLILGEAEESTGKANLARLIQNWNRFILQQIHAEFIDAETMAKLKEQTSGLSALKLSLPPDSKSRNKDSKKEKSDNGSDKKGEAKKGSTSSGSNGEGDAPTSSQAEAPMSPIDSDPSLLDKDKDSKDTIISRLFGTELVNKFRCRCGEEMKRDMKSSIFDLIYPDTSLPTAENAKGPRRFTFSEVVQKSMCLEQSTQAWCNKCAKYQPHVQTKKLKTLPDILAFNCHLESEREIEFWRTQEKFARSKAKSDPSYQQEPVPQSNVKMCRYADQCRRRDCHFRHPNDADRPQPVRELTGEAAYNKEILEPSWVPLGLKLKLNNQDQSLQVEDAEDNTPIDHTDAFNYYEHLGSIANIKESKNGGTLVAQIYITEKYHQRKEKVTCTQWYLFNDFAITPIEKEEATNFNMDWKIPCVLYFMRRDLAHRHTLTVDSKVTASALFENASLVTPRRKLVTFTPLDDCEMPKEGTVVGLDAEFVTLNQEEAELRSDGTRSTIKPSQMSVARVTCVRGSGMLVGEPFIDDYISTQEQVVDYLTQFSGIKPGDLDASISSKHLTTLKSTYIKLRYLVDVGVIFVGHGLKKDFRVININVPKKQVIDTVELFQLPRQRMISLKFLAWYFLNVNIQSVTHDSIEDARTALKLYEIYKELQKEGNDVLQEKLKEMYSKGRELSWKIPEDGTPASAATAEKVDGATAM